MLSCDDTKLKTLNNNGINIQHKGHSVSMRLPKIDFEYFKSRLCDDSKTMDGMKDEKKMWRL